MEDDFFDIAEKGRTSKVGTELPRRFYSTGSDPFHSDDSVEEPSRAIFTRKIWNDSIFFISYEF